MSTPPDPSLVPVTVDEVAKDLTLSRQGAGAPAPGDLEAQAETLVRTLVSQTTSSKGAEVEAVETIGTKEQKKAAYLSEMLKLPIHTMGKRGADGGDVARTLIDLKMLVEDLDPGAMDAQPGWASRLIGKLPGVGTPLKRYFSKFESAQTAISSIIRALDLGRQQLDRDNITLGEDQKRLREALKDLEKAAAFGMLLDQKLQHWCDRDGATASPENRAVVEEALFLLRQRIIDLKQQIAVSQQGFIAMELIKRNNKELIRGVQRAQQVTVTALQVAATVALALGNQKLVLDRVEAVNKTTSDLIAGTAARLKTQGVQIHKQAAGAMIDMNALKAAFADLRHAISDLDQFRRQALPQLAASISAVDTLTAEAGQTVKHMEDGRLDATERLLVPKSRG